MLSASNKNSTRLCLHLSQFRVYFQQKGRFREAIAAYQKALSIKPDLALTYNNLGNVMKRLNKFDAAIKYYQKAIKIQPDNIETIYYNLGNAFKQNGKIEAAVRAFEQALEITPNYAPAKLGICISQLPIIYSSIDEIEFKRNQYQQHLQNLAHSYQLTSQEERTKSAEAVGTFQPFYLAYQGLNDSRITANLWGNDLPDYVESLSPMERERGSAEFR